MPGIEKMTAAIMEDAKKEADTIIAKVTRELDENKARNDADIQEELSKLQESLERELVEYRERAGSARDLQRRRMVLAKKQEIIQRIVEKTRVAMHDADAQTYFANIYKMFEKYCRPEDGVMVLNSQDLGRLPSDFTSRIEQIAKSKGGTVSVSKDATAIEDGFVLIYGGTEENCTFRALIESGKEELYDTINKMLWR